ncbi:MAG: ROK family protein [Magnetococcales bacterium]|nr:ROK family protein [Magnetococcales bacterium]NGZ27933.1 ROK family protein [Magnetococcales bacterium]
MRIGIDLGGTKIEGILLAEEGTILARHRLPTPQGDYEATLAQVARVVEKVTQNQHISPRHPVGVGMPGTLSPDDHLVMNANSVCLMGHPLDQDLSRLLGRPVRLANDADCFALSEATDGAAAGAGTVFGVILGTGVGGGVVVQGRLLQGPNRIAGEWGHNPLPWPSLEEIPGPLCYCGKHGCIETFLCGPALERDYFQASGERCTASVIDSLANEGNPLAVRLMQLYVQRLARALASVINLIDPHVVVLGGGLSNLSRLYPVLPELMIPYLFSNRLRTAILPAKYGDSSGVRGAAWLWSPAELP